MTVTIVPLSDATEQQARSAEPKIGQWYWATERVRERGYHDEDLDDTIKLIAGEEEPAMRWLGCITHVGSNYVQLEGVRRHNRYHFDEFDDHLTYEPEPDLYLKGKVALHQGHAAKVLREIQQLTARLGIIERKELSDKAEEGSTALAVVHGTADIQAHKLALIEAKKKTLPELFKQVKEQHELMAMWMQAELIPMKADMAKMKRSTDVIDDRIFTVELYAGLIEELVQVAKGKPAPNDTKIALFQRRHYMDEECLLRYQAGGMEFKDIESFDKWIKRKENRDRILPLPRCIVAFRVRRFERDRGHAKSVSDFIQFWYDAQADKQTYLYIRNGEQLFRLATAIEFGSELFADREESTLLGSEQLYVQTNSTHPDVISQQHYENMKENYREARKEHAAQLRAWKKGGKKPGDRPWHSDYPSDKSANFEPCTPASAYYDDAMEQIAKEMRAHNRIAVVLQGLLDRSTAFHPHPPWRLWTPEGFMAGIELIYDQSKTLTPGPAPDFEAYRARLNASLEPGCFTVGQEDAWLRAEAVKENKRRENDYRRRWDNQDLEHYKPYNNDGPGHVAKVITVRGGSASFTWNRESQRRKRVSSRPGWTRLEDNIIRDKFICPIGKLLNVDAYTPGDYLQFFDDPRTRANYIQWAPFLLAAEDFKAGKKHGDPDE